MTPKAMTPQGFDEALSALGWKGADFCTRAGLVQNTVWRWRKGLVPIPLWAGEYLRAMLALQRLHAEFVAVSRGPASEPTSATPGDDAEASDNAAQQGAAAR